MRWIKFKGQTHSFGAPPGISEQVCKPLPLRISDESKMDSMGLSFRSYWKPDQEELQALLSGASIELLVRGTAHPPVMLSIRQVEEVHDA